MQVMLFRIDEKGSMSLVIWMYGNFAPQFGSYNVWNRIHHINSIGRLLAICTVVITLFGDRGGKAFKTGITGCGSMVEAHKDSCKTVFRDNATYHYPNIPDECLSKKGKEYFEN